MHTLIAGDCEITHTNDPTFSPGSADNIHTYDHVHLLGPDSYASSQHVLRTTVSECEASSCLLAAGGGATGIHENSATIVDSICFIAVGQFIASLKLPTLELNWATQADDATCFGVYKPTNHNCLISHGELSIARFTLDGKIVWDAGGADIFTNGFRLDRDIVRATDFNDRRYAFDINTGRGVAA